MRARSGRKGARVIALHFCKLFTHARELFIRAPDLFVGVREPFIGARDWGIAGFSFFWIRRGVHWRFPFPSNVIRRWRSLSVSSTIRQRSVQSCPKNGRMMVEYGIAWQ